MEFVEITAALAHEIKNPAAVALAHVNLLRLELGEEYHLNHIEQALNSICAIVRDMLAAPHSQANDLYEVDLQKILCGILETYRAAWPDISFVLRGCEEDVNFISEQPLNTPAPLVCRGNEISLRMIFSNLIKNAVEAIEAGGEAGKIEITAWREQGYINVKIADNAVVSNVEKPHGNGLGLAICRNLANGLGAELCGEGAGVVVRVHCWTSEKNSVK
ncbi:MAG: HAMP domain-containing histidine kinase [Defluviitaleaceae bacterium]|nr:HAMP domain-containing histidine kinase [Defluviitaleaceae bacterium]